MMKMLRRMGIAVGCVLIVLVAVVLAGYYLFFRAPPAANFPAAHTSAEANQQDLAYLRHLPARDRSFTSTTAAAFYRAVDALKDRAGGLDRIAFNMEIARVVALANNAHTTTKGLPRGRNANALPIRFGWFAEGLFVVKAMPTQSDLLGAQVLEENGFSPATLHEKLHVYVGGNDARARQFIPNFLESPAILHAVGMSPSPHEVSLKLRLRDGHEIDRVVPEDSAPLAESSDHWPARDLGPVPVAGENRGWSHVLDGKPLPLFLSRPDDNYWHTSIDDLSLIYIQINDTENQENGTVTLRQYLVALLSEVRAKRPHNIVVDLRFNGGGNYLLAYSFAKHLPEALPADGQIFIVTGNPTFSAAIVTVAVLKHYAGSRGVIIGEQMSDDETFWAEGRDMILPNSKIQVHYATGYHNWGNGCYNPIRCYWPNLVIGVAAGSLKPSITAPLYFPDYAAGKDGVMDAVSSSITGAKSTR